MSQTYDDEPMRWVGDWMPSPYSREQAEVGVILVSQIQNMLVPRHTDHSQLGSFDPGSRKEMMYKLAHAMDVRPNALEILHEWKGFLPGVPRMDVAINLQRAMEANMYYPTDFRDWPVICRLMGTGVPRADEHRKQRCDAQTVFIADLKLWSYRFEDQQVRELTCLR